MKRLIVVLLLLAPAFNVSAQKIIDSFIGLKFGSTSQQAIVSAKSKGGIQDIKSSSGNFLIFDKIKIAGRSTQFVAYSFIGGKLYGGIIFYKPSTEGQTMELFDKLKEELDGVYGESELYKNYKYPYEEGDGHELTAIRLGKGSVICYWSSEMPNGIKNSIKLEITEDLEIEMSYQDGTLFKGVVASQKEKAKSEY